MEKKVLGNLDHIAIAVKDIEKAKAHFSALLDTEFVWLGTIEQAGLVSWISPTGLELLGPTKPDGDLAKFLERRGEGLYALAFTTWDIDKAKAKAEELGSRVVGDITLEEGPAKGLREVWLHPKDNFGAYTMFTQGNPFRP